MGDKAGLGTTYNNIGGIYDKKGEWDKALASYQRGLDIQTAVKDVATESVTRYNMAIILKNQQKFDAAIAHLERVVEIDQKIGHPDLESDSQTLQQVQLEKLVAEQGWSALLPMLEGKERADVCNRIGIDFIRQTQGDSAAVYFQQALAYYQDRPDSVSQQMVGRLYNNLGSAYKVKKDWEKARQWLTKSIAYNQQFGDSVSVLGYSYGHLCEVHAAQKESEPAIAAGEKSLALCRKHHLKDRECQTITALLPVYEQTGRDAASLRARQRELGCAEQK